MPLTLTAPSRAAVADVLLTAASAGVDLPFTPGPSLALTTPDGAVVTESNAACVAVAEAGGRTDALLGADAEARAVVADWCARRHTTFAPVTEAGLKELNDHLLSRTYLAGGAAPTLADLVLAAVLAFAVSNFPAAQVAHFPAVARWYDHVAATAPGADGELLPRGRLERPAMQAPAPPPAPAAAAGGPAAPQKGGEGDKKKGGADAKACAAPAVAPAAAAAGAAAPPAPVAAASKKKDKKDKPAKPAPAPARDPEAFDVLDVRVGRILDARKHPDADSLYVETVDCGDADGPRTVVSGLAKHLPLDALANRLVVCVCNLKPATMRGITSAAMVLCGVDDAAGACDPVHPPPAASPGDRVTVAGYDGEPLAQVNTKKSGNAMEKVAAHLTTGAGGDGACLYRGLPLTVGGAAVTSTVKGGIIR